MMRDCGAVPAATMSIQEPINSTMPGLDTLFSMRETIHWFFVEGLLQQHRHLSDRSTPLQTSGGAVPTKHLYTGSISSHIQKEL